MAQAYRSSISQSKDPSLPSSVISHHCFYTAKVWFWEGEGRGCSVASVMAEPGVSCGSIERLPAGSSLEMFSTSSSSSETNDSVSWVEVSVQATSMTEQAWQIWHLLVRIYEPQASSIALLSPRSRQNWSKSKKCDLAPWFRSSDGTE